jgi:hypothetical protein
MRDEVGAALRRQETHHPLPDHGQTGLDPSELARTEPPGKPGRRPRRRERHRRQPRTRSIRPRPVQPGLPTSSSPPLSTRSRCLIRPIPPSSAPMTSSRSTSSVTATSPADPVTVGSGAPIQRGARPRAVIGRHDRAVGQRDRGDLAGPEAVLDPLAREVLASDTELVLLLAGHAEDLGNVLRGLAHRDIQVGQLTRRARVHPCLRAAGRALLGPGLRDGEERVLSLGVVREALAYRLTVSTPTEMYALPSPALIAWNAIRVVCRLLAQ